MLAVLTILAIAVTDLIRLAEHRTPGRIAQYLQLLWWVLVVLAAVIWIRPEGWAGVVAALVAAAWYYATEHLGSTTKHSTVAAWSGVGLVATIAGFAWLDVVVLQGVTYPGVMWIALTLFLTQSGNHITRSVLLLSGRGVDGNEPTGAVPGSTLKGGRVIGPLERIFITVLTVVGAYHVIAALMAAKGIVRFPEISADAKRDPAESTAGTKAEEFLVGSLASWGLAGAAGLLAFMLG